MQMTSTSSFLFSKGPRHKTQFLVVDSWKNLPVSFIVVQEFGFKELTTGAVKVGQGPVHAGLVKDHLWLFHYMFKACRNCLQEQQELQYQLWAHCLHQMVTRKLQTTRWSASPKVTTICHNNVHERCTIFTMVR